MKTKLLLIASYLLDYLFTACLCTTFDYIPHSHSQTELFFGQTKNNKYSTKNSTSRSLSVSEILNSPGWITIDRIDTVQDPTAVYSFPAQLFYTNSIADGRDP